VEGGDTSDGALASVGTGRRKLIAGTTIFVALTVGVFVYQFARIDAADAGPTLAGLRWGYGLLILLAIPLEPFATSARIWVVCRVLHPGVSMWTAFQADSANMGLAMLTPSQTGGGLAQIYLLRRAGLRLATALTASLLSFVGTLVGLLCMGLYSILAGGAGADASALFSVAVWTVTVSAGLMLVGGLFPALLRVPLAALSRGFARLTGRTDKLVRWHPDGVPLDGDAERMGPWVARIVAVVYDYRRDAARFARTGKVAFVAVILLTLLFLFARCLMAFLAVRFLGLDASLGEVLEIQSALIFIIYFAPTPGSAGVAEGASLVAMGGIVGAGFAPYYNLLWRFTTGYLQAFAGMLFLARAVSEDARTALQSRRADEAG